ncbi:anaphase-promoting complex subunit 5-domain-containing protein [Amylocarpus encephaloides]|uniref:Anaphase-promoting complex subunit 5 n=1 Tax=Amylocarpus encephaloides TaxID=45428 RepID=A0A9P7YA07_9HELO|nr:anaphase-promoting complex subunit 5-domain-containing protein [Amylocarpus encephaloides]
MPRFLTPTKIGLLLLIDLYMQGAVPNSSSIPILSFLVRQLLPNFTNRRTRASPIESPIESLHFILDLGSFEALLLAHPALVPGRTLWDQFLKMLWSIDSLNALHGFFATRANLLANTAEENRMLVEMGIPRPPVGMLFLSRSSPFGSFARESRLEFYRLRFDDSLALWVSFVEWRQATKGYYLERNGSLGRWIGDRSLADGEADWGTDATEMLRITAYGIDGFGKIEGGRVSTGDIGKLLQFQVEQMQKFGDRVPLAMKDSFKGILENSLVVSSLTHYLKFLDAWRAGDYPTSFDNLHRYFDYTKRNRRRFFYQYALMNLAVLQADFGCLDEALATMIETISTARENQDMVCLNFALSWLYHFGKAHPNLVHGTETSNITDYEREGLMFLRTKAKETGTWTLWSSSLLSEAKLVLSNGESVSSAFENIQRSSQLVFGKGMKNMVGPQMAMTSSIWGRLGVSLLSRQYCQIFLSCHARDAVFDDLMRFSCRMAHLLTENGHYDDGIRGLEKLNKNSLRSWKANQHWQIYRGALRLKVELRRDNLENADRLLQQLLQFKGAGSDPDLTFEINILHVDYLTRRTDLGRALAKIDGMASALQEEGGDINPRLRLLTVKALLHSESGRPQKGFSLAVRAANMAWSARLLPALWAAMGAIANALNSLSEFQAASSILVAVIPRAYECEDCGMIAKLYSFLVDSHMGIAGQASSDSVQREKHLSKSLDYLNRAFEEYSAVEDIRGQSEIMAKEAILAIFLGDDLFANLYDFEDELFTNLC